jgi:hypothetical protein
MKSKLELLFIETEKLVLKLNITDQYDFENLVEIREEVLKQLLDRSSLTDNDRQLLLKIQSRHAILLQRMMKIREEALLTLAKIQRSKLQKNVYENSYSSESYFIDRKK